MLLQYIPHHDILHILNIPHILAYQVLVYISLVIVLTYYYQYRPTVPAHHPATITYHLPVYLIPYEVQVVNLKPEKRGRQQGGPLFGKASFFVLMEREGESRFLGDIATAEQSSTLKLESLETAEVMSDSATAPGATPLPPGWVQKCTKAGMHRQLGCPYSLR